MRHQVRGRKLGRTKPHRKATLQALSCALIKERRIKTTLAKAKELRTYIEPLITTAKVDNTHNRRKAFSVLQDKYAVTELFEEVGPAAADRPGGYTRVLKLGFRLGDAADMAVIELVDFNDVQPEKKEAKKKRTRRAGKSNKPETPVKEKKEEVKPEVKAEDKKDEAEAVTEELADSTTSAEETTSEEVISEAPEKKEKPAQ
ncbi:MAG: 50S ribosomal protein L17 [Balneolaceae bacterium]|nr:MAG: 50S ribosomal protein L17 [Balneolaceae bacterium]